MNSSTLAKQVLLLKNEVLFERYLRHKYMKQFTQLNKENIQASSFETYIASLVRLL